jgi:electron transport complex protein RnfG
VKHILKPALSLFIITAIATALLALVRNMTLEPIARQNKATQEKTMKAILGSADYFREIPIKKTGSIVRIFEGSKDGIITGYVIEQAPAGYSGAINMMTGILYDKNEIAGMRILKHTETPGLGALAVKENFFRQYDGKKLIPLKVIKALPGENDIETITGATITTKAITNAVNEAMEWYMGADLK